MTNSAHERFWGRVSFSDSCWTWNGALSASGYGTVVTCNRRRVRAHRWAYEACRGPIPEGLVIDHLCRNRACVNPWHMEPVTPRENTLRGLSPAAVASQRNTCAQGHEYTTENTVYYQGTRGRGCRICRRASLRAAKTRYRAKNRS